MNAPLLTTSSPAGRRLLVTTVLGSGMVFLDSTIANVALPRIGHDLNAGLTGLQWVVNGYALTLAALIIVGGSLGDRFGLKRVYGVGVAAFVLASVLVAIAPTIGLLVVARLVQGIAAAALTPGSLALLQASFQPDERLKAIGSWTGMLGIATAAGPVVGGWLVGIDWRYGFWINAPLGAVVLLLLRSTPVPETPRSARPLDVPAVVLTVTMLTGLTWALTSWDGGFGPLAAVAAVASLLALLVVEHRTDDPMIPLDLFRNRVFTSINASTFFIYLSFTGSLFFIALFLQMSAQWSPLAAGAATLPISAIMLVLSGPFGSRASRVGGRNQMVLGMVTVACAFLWLSSTPAHPEYLLDLLPPICLQGIGMSMLVSALTGTVLAAAPAERTGLASGINNAIARTAGLVSVALLPLAAGLSGDSYRHGPAVAHAYCVALKCCSASMVVAALVTGLGLTSGSGLRRRPLVRRTQADPVQPTL